jgi:RimJ/RimL family protein N-acetyltransferase
MTLPALGFAIAPVFDRMSATWQPVGPLSGYQGPPVDGLVEIGHSVVPSWQRRGVATEASQALIQAAWDRGARTVIAHTFPQLAPSTAVLRKLGFERSGVTGQGELEFSLRRR